ncbi:MAG: DUF4347 domain-containing protein, partial [Magnetococcales bacterium]|nr:DUF4347 domain-containing protein [Magnetococcales bacterium]
MMPWLKAQPLIQRCRNLLANRRGEQPSRAAAPLPPADFWALEPRLMFDGAGVLEHIPLLDAVDGVVDTSPPTHPAEPSSPAVPPPEPAKERHEIVFIDARVTDVETLRQGVKPGQQVVVLAADRDGVEQIAQVLAQNHTAAEGKPFDAIHILSHGREGEVVLGTTVLSSGTLPHYSETLRAWGNSLTGQGDLLFYGCEVGGGSKGALFVSQIARLTGADVAASSDLTGAAQKGGNWTLEVASGKIEADIVFDAATRQGYEGVLTTYTIALDATTLQNTINAAANGDTITFSSGGTITLTGTQISISKNITINGDLDGNNTPDVTIDGANLSRVINVGTGKTATLNGLIISGGKETSSVGGGGIYNQGTLLTINYSTITGNDVGALRGGGIYNTGGLTINYSTISNNTALGSSGDAAGLYNDNSGKTTAINNSTIYNNRADDIGGGLRNAAGTMNLTSCTVYGNTSGTGGGLAWNSGTVTLSKTIIAGNTLTNGTANDVSGTVDATLGYNFIGTNSTATGLTNNVNNNTVGTGTTTGVLDPLLTVVAGSSPAYFSSSNTTIATLGAGDNRDNTAPTVSSVSSSTADGSYKAGSSISITVTFSESVIVNTTGGTPYITMETGTTDRNASYSSGSGSSTLVFTYTVQAGDTSSDLDYTTTSALALNSGTIKDAAGNSAVLTLASPGAVNSLGNNKAIVIDTTAPTQTVGSVAISADTGTSTSDFLTKTAAQTITATLSGALAGTDILYGSLDNGTTWTDITSKVSGTAITWNTATL